MAEVFDLLQQYPFLAAAAVFVLVAVGAVQYTLGPRHDWVESFRQRWWLRLHEALSALEGYAVTTKGPSDYVCTIEMGEEALERALYRQGYHRNITASKKMRRLPGGDEQWSEGSWVHREGLFAERQDHLTIFPGHAPGTLDLYHHNEASNVPSGDTLSELIGDMFNHYRGIGMDPGDPERTLRDALDAEDIDYYRDEEWLEGFGGHKAV